MVSISVDTSQMGELAFDLEQEYKRVNLSSRFIVAEVAAALEEQVKMTVPVVTGTLRDSIRTEHDSDPPLGIFAAEVGTDVEYGYDVELGINETHHNPAPRWGPAADEADDLLYEKLKDMLS